MKNNTAEHHGPSERPTWGFHTPVERDPNFEITSPPVRKELPSGEHLALVPQPEDKSKKPMERPKKVEGITTEDVKNAGLNREEIEKVIVPLRDWKPEDEAQGDVESGLELEDVNK